jgi:hypothetical protein
MTVAATLAALKTRFEAMSSPPQMVYADPQEAMSLSNFPEVVMTLAPQVDMTWYQKDLGQGGHDYTVAIYWLVGSRTLTPLPVLHSLVLPWIRPIADVIAADVTLGGAITMLGSEATPGQYFKYQVGSWAWGDGVYFGLRILLPVTELVQQTQG